MAMAAPMPVMPRPPASPVPGATAADSAAAAQGAAALPLVQSAAGIGAGFPLPHPGWIHQSSLTDWNPNLGLISSHSPCILFSG